LNSQSYFICLSRVEIINIGIARPIGTLSLILQDEV
jgi:hypothetical protein